MFIARLNVWNVREGDIISGIISFLCASLTSHVTEPNRTLLAAEFLNHLTTLGNGKVFPSFFRRPLIQNIITKRNGMSTKKRVHGRRLNKVEEFHLCSGGSHLGLFPLPQPTLRLLPSNNWNVHRMQGAGRSITGVLETRLPVD